MVATVRRGRRSSRRPGIVVHGNVAGSIQYGDHNVQVNGNHGTVVIEKVTATRNRRPVAAAPRRPDPFVARSAELQRLAAAIGAHGAITVSGPPGAGRTALLRAAANLPQAGLPDGVLRLDGVDDAGTALSVGDLAQRLHDAAWDCEPAARVSLESARTQLGAIQALAIVDDVGLPDRDLERLADLLPAGAVLIATGAAPASGDFDDVPVGALDRSDAVALLRARAGLGPVDAPDDPSGAHLFAICELLADWPEALVVAGRAMMVDQLSPAAAHESIAAVAPTSVLPHEIALERAWALARPGLDEHARRLLVAASVLPGRTHDPALLRRVLGEPDWFGPAADTLQALGLITLNSPRYRVPDGIRGLLSGERDAIETDEIRDRHLDVTLEAAKERALDPGFVPSEIGALLGAFDHAQHRGRLEDAVRLGRLIAPQLVLNGLWDAWERVAAAVGHAAERLGWTADVAWSAHELGTRDLVLGHNPAAQQALEEALRLREELGDEEGAAYTEHNLGRLGGGGWWNGPLRRYLLGGGALVVGLLMLGVVGPPVAGFVQDWIQPDPTESPAPTDAAVASSSPAPTIVTAAPSASQSPLPSDVPDPLVIATELGAYEFDGRDWATTLQITLTGGRGDYLVMLDGLGESRESPSTFELSGRDCERYTVTGTASSAGEQQTPITVDVGPSECPSLQPELDVACITFDDLELGTTYGEPAGQKPGELVYQSAEGIRVHVHDFLYSNEGGTFNRADINEPSTEFGSGPWIFFNNLNFEFDLSGLPFDPRRVEFAFRDQGGNQNFSVNGSEVHRQLILEAPSPIGGVSWSWDQTDDGRFFGMLDGTVERFLIGGQEFSLDTVCAHR